MSGLLGLQRRMMELGRVRLGEKGPKGEPRKLDIIRLTSASKTLLEAASEEFGGTVRPWEGAPDEGYFELYTERSEIPIVIPPVFAAVSGEPTYPFSQFYEAWKGGGCQRRCDGVTEALSGSPCLCDPGARLCEIVTRFSFIIPDVPGIGLWRMESGGINAAIELPATLEFLSSAAAAGRYIHAVLRLEQRSSKKDGQTRRFVVPVVDVPGIKTRDMLGTGELPALNGPTVTPPRPALPNGPAAPQGDDATFDMDDRAGFGEAPALPGDVDPVVDADSSKVTADQKHALNALHGELTRLNAITTEQVYAALAKTRNIEVEAMIEVLDGRKQNGDLSFAKLRDSLTKVEASDLIDRLGRLADNVKATVPA